METTIFLQLSLLILLAIGVSFIARLLRQPLIIAYIITGILAGPVVFNIIQENQVISIFSEFGVAFLLFIVGLHLSPRVIKEVGKVSLVTGVGQVIFTAIVGYFIGLILGFPPIVAVYISVALTFSSTIIIMKLLSDKEDLEKLYGKISIGFLIVQDLIAILILLILSSFTTVSGTFETLAKSLGLGFIIVLILTLFSIFILPKLGRFFAKSQEFLFIFSIGWGLGLASLFYYFNFSLEVGALIAGVLLSISPYHYEVSSKLKPLRDFFIISFFIILGSQLVFTEVQKFIVPIILFSIFILIGNPIIVMILMGLLGYSKKTGFMAGLTVAQISEFSLILIALGVKTGQLSGEILSLVTTVGLITIAGSSYMILYSERIYRPLEKYLKIFERKKIIDKNLKEHDYDYLLFGYNRVGFSVLQAFKSLKKKFLIVDFNPEIIKKLSSRRVPCVYGDMDDLELLDQLKVQKSKMIISTIPDLDSNILMINKVRETNKEAIILVTSRQISESFELYKAGADYVVLPHFLGGEYTAKLIEENGLDKKLYEKEKLKNIKELRERIREGHEHPRVEKEK